MKAASSLSAEMAVEGEGANGSSKLEKAPCEGLITYQRKKRAKPASGGNQYELGTEDIDDTISCTNSHEPEKHARMYNPWRSILEHILELPGISEEGGIVNCIHDALEYGPGYSRNFKGRCLLDTEKGQCQPLSFVNDECCASETRTSDAKKYTAICKNALVDILCSEEFSLLCDLYWESFQEMTVESFFDFSLVDSKMKNGDYELSPGPFDQDIQQVWHKFQKVGQQMVLLASKLSSMSDVSCQMRFGDAMAHGADAHKPEGNHQVNGHCNNSVASLRTNLCELNNSVRPDKIEESVLYKVCKCELCGMEANGERSLICDGCEVTYHVSCVEPALNEIPTRSWYCTSCIVHNNDSPDLNHMKNSSLHENCAVCNRLEVSEPKSKTGEIQTGTVRDNVSRKNSVSNMDSDDPLVLSMSAENSICKICGTCEDEDKKFLICGHAYCPYKFYHIICLTSSQMASQQQENKPCWYCPSCLCRDCFCDKDDDKIVLCDGCDEAHHTYCMRPRRTSIPKGQWYCVQCNIARAREGMKRYEQRILQRHRKNEDTPSSEANKSMDMLLCAAEKLRSEDKLISGRR